MTTVTQIYQGSSRVVLCIDYVCIEGCNSSTVYFVVNLRRLKPYRNYRLYDLEMRELLL